MADGEHVGLALAAAAPDGSDGVEDIPRGRGPGGRRLRLPRPAAAEPLAFLQDLRPAGAVDRAVHAPAAEQRLVGGVDDRVRLNLRDVADLGADHARGSFPFHVPSEPYGRKRANSSSRYQRSSRVRRTTSRWGSRPYAYAWASTSERHRLNVACRATGHSPMPTEASSPGRPARSVAGGRIEV